MTPLTADQLKAQAHALRAQLTAPELLKKLIYLENALEQFKPKVALMGGWNAGKSTLLNELLNLNKLLPSSALPETSTLIELTYDASAVPQPKLTLIERSGAQHQVDMSEFKEAAQRHPEIYLHVGLPHEALRGFDLIDTPGDNSTDPHHQAVFEVLMRETELTLYVIRADRFVLRNDLKHLQALCARSEARHVKVVFTHEDLTTADQRAAIEEGLRELLPELSAPLWATAPLSSASREGLLKGLSSWVAQEGHSAHLARLARAFERLQAEQRALLHQDVLALKAGEQLARLSELERAHELAVCAHQSESLRQRLTHALSLCEARLKVVFQERFELLRQGFWAEGQGLDPQDRDALERFNQRLSTGVGELITEVQALVTRELAETLNAQLPEDAHISPLHADIQALSFDDILGEISDLLEALPAFARELAGRVELLLRRDPKLVILVKILRTLRAKENFTLALSELLDALSRDLMTPLHAWWQDLAQRMTTLFEERLSHYEAQLQALSQGSEHTKLLLELQEKESALKALS